MPTLCKLFWKTEVTLSNVLYETSITRIPKSYKHITGKENSRPIFLKQNLSIYKKIIYLDQVRFIPVMQDSFTIWKTINERHHINRINDKNHINISREAEKIPNPFLMSYVETGANSEYI